MMRLFVQERVEGDELSRQFTTEAVAWTGLRAGELSDGTPLLHAAPRLQRGLTYEEDTEVMVPKTLGTSQSVPVYRLGLKLHEVTSVLQGFEWVADATPGKEEEYFLALNLGTGLSFDPVTGAINASGGPGGSAIEVQDEGATLTAGLTRLNFVGSGVAAASGGGGIITVTVSAQPLSAWDEGASLSTNVAGLNFVGAGVTASHSSGVITVTIPGGATLSGTADRVVRFVTSSTVGNSILRDDGANVAVGGAINASYKLYVYGAGFYTGAVTATQFNGSGTGLTNVLRLAEGGNITGPVTHTATFKIAGVYYTTDPSAPSISGVDGAIYLITN